MLSSLPRKVLTLAFIVRERAASRAAHAAPSSQPTGAAAGAANEVVEVLLGEKKRGFGMGKWNGFGGKVDPGDTSIVAAAAREIQEEANVTVRECDLDPRGVLLFTFEGGKEVLEVHVFLTTKFAGEPSESEEMLPKWYAVGDIPFDKMWADDHIWLPHVLAGKSVDGAFHFSSDEDTLLTHELQVT
ncbi:hypothetical protein Gpo141_00002794 [Globisporangium polare]